MGEVVLHYEDRKRNYLTESSLNLAAICSEEAFHFLITGSDNTPILARGFQYVEGAPFYHAPLAYFPKLMASNDVLFSDFSETKIAIRGLPFELIAESDHQASQAREMLSGIMAVSDNDTVRSEYIPEYDLFLVTAYPKRLIEEIHQYFGNAKLQHFVTCLLRASGIAEGPVMDLAFGATIFELVVGSGRTVLFANSFPWHAESDVLYFVCAIVEELGLQADNVRIRAGGAGLTNALQQYLRMHLPQVHHVGEEHIDDARISNLVSVSQCGS